MQKSPFRYELSQLYILVAMGNILLILQEGLQNQHPTPANKAANLKILQQPW